MSIEYKINHLFNEQLLFWESGIRRWNEDGSNPTGGFFSFMVIRDRLIEELLVLPSFFSILAICSFMFSVVFGTVYYPYLHDSVRDIVLGLMIIPFAIGVPIRYRLKREIARLDWKGHPNATAHHTHPGRR